MLLCFLMSFNWEEGVKNWLLKKISGKRFLFFKKFLLPIFLLIFLLILNFGTNIWLEKNKELQDILTIVFLDVGQGDSILIKTPNNKIVLIDGGPTSKTIRSLQNFISFHNKKIDLLIATHNDMDHIGGFPEIFDRFNVFYYADYGLEENGEVINLVKAKILNENLLGKIILRAGNKIILDQNRNITLEILWPVTDFNSSDRNEHSVVMLLQYEDFKVLLTGDASIKIEEYLIYKFEDILSSQVLKVGHHGSKTSTGELFLEKTNPEYVIISAGKNNKFNHPHPEVVQKITDRNILMLNTAEAGNIVFKTDGKSFWLE
jgi:competence protein ComEC